MSLISDALMSDIIFYVVAFAMVATAVAVVLAKNLLQSAVFLIFSFIGTAVLYLLLHAEFNAMAQIMVYAGGVVIFVIFTILLTSHLGESVLYVKLPRTFIALIISAALFAMLVAAGSRMRGQVEFGWEGADGKSARNGAERVAAS